MRSKRSTPNEPRLCDFNKVELRVPRLKLVRLLFKRSYLDYEETVFLRGMLWKTEAAENRILHIKSIVEKTLLKAGGSRA